MTRDLETMYAAALGRYRCAALALADTGRSADPLRCEEALTLLIQLRSAFRVEGGGDWLERELPAVQSEIATRLDEKVPHWRTDPPGWAATYLMPGIVAELVNMER